MVDDRFGGEVLDGLLLLISNDKGFALHVQGNLYLLLFEFDSHRFDPATEVNLAHLAHSSAPGFVLQDLINRL